MAIIIPSHIGSTPNISNAGPTIGTTTRVIWIKSKINPNKNISIITTRTAPNAPPGNSVNIPVIRSSPPNPLKTRENTEEPKSIINTMAVISVVVSTASDKFFLVRLLLLSANIIAPKAPTPAASVGVAIPRRIEPSTDEINTKGGNKEVSIILHLPETTSTFWEGAIWGER